MSDHTRIRDYLKTHERELHEHELDATTGTTRGERRGRAFMGAAAILGVLAVVAWLARDVMSDYWPASAIDDVYWAVGAILGLVVCEYYVIRGVVRDRRSGIRNTDGQVLRIFATFFVYVLVVLSVVSFWIDSE